MVPCKTCTFDCLYCQLGRSRKKSFRRAFYIDEVKFIKELKSLLKKPPRIDYITISGSGEPTLHKNIDRIIGIIKKITRNRYPICVVTNSSFLYRKSVRKELKGADLIIPSLDAPTEMIFKKINRPCGKMTLKKIVKGLIALRKEFQGKIWLEIMLIRGINDKPAQASGFKDLIGLIRPDKVHLNLAVRPSPLEDGLPGKESISRIKDILGPEAEVVCDFGKNSLKTKIKVLSEKVILDYLSRRPASFNDLSIAFGFTEKELILRLDSLRKTGLVKAVRSGAVTYYRRYD